MDESHIDNEDTSKSEEMDQQAEKEKDEKDGKEEKPEIGEEKPEIDLKGKEEEEQKPKMGVKNDEQQKKGQYEEEGDEANKSEEDEHEEAPVVEQVDPAPLYRDPTFAELCSFFNMFTPLFGLKPISIAKLEAMFCTTVDGDGLYFFNLIKKTL